MKTTNQITPEYKRRLNKARLIVRGRYKVIADRAGVKVPTVNAVMAFKFYNKDVLREAERLAKLLT